MAIVKMQRVSIFGLNKDRESILERLQELGVVQIDFHEDEIKDMPTRNTSDEKADYEREIQKTEQALDILNHVAPEKTSLLDSLAGKPLIEKRQMNEMLADQQKYRDIADQILTLDKNITEARAEIARLQNQTEALTPWLELDIPIESSGSIQTKIFLGLIGSEMSEEAILTLLKTNDPPVEAVDIEIIHQEKDHTYLSVVCLRNDADTVEEVLRKNGFAKPSSIPNGIPAETKAGLEKAIGELEEAIETYKQQICNLADNRQALRMLSDQCRIQAERSDISGQLPQTEKTFALSGYVPAKYTEKLKQEFSENYIADVEIEEVGEKENAPVLLKNNAFSNSVEGVLESFGLPGKGEIDPTTIMSFFYVFLFGLMLSDAAYGAIISIACGVVLLKFKRMEPSLRKSIKMFFWCGISTLFWGVMFGGYFGDAITVIAKTFFGKTVTIKALWFVPLDDPMRMLVYSLLFGVIHLFTGLGLKGYLLLKDKNIVGFICDVVSWYLFLIGLILMLLPTEIFHSISQMDFNFGPGLNMAAKVMAIAGALIILVMSGRRKKKKIGLRLALGAYDLYNITGWLSDVLSYSRLLALGLATGVIAQVINQMGSMMGKSVLGVIFFIVVFIVGHILNMAINILGAYVHTNRLQFVEFFGKFYEGGGKPFKPFMARTKYVDIQEEN